MTLFLLLQALEWSKRCLELQQAWQSVCSNSAECGKPALEFQCHWGVQRPTFAEIASRKLVYVPFPLTFTESFLDKQEAKQFPQSSWQLQSFAQPAA